MTDSKALVKLEFHIYGKEFKHEMYINWSVDDRIDERVIAWFEDKHSIAYHAFEARVFEDQRAAREKENERKERAELERLQKKYANAG